MDLLRKQYPLFVIKAGMDRRHFSEAVRLHCKEKRYWHRKRLKQSGLVDAGYDEKRRKIDDEKNVDEAASFAVERMANVASMTRKDLDVDISLSALDPMVSEESQPLKVGIGIREEENGESKRVFRVTRKISDEEIARRRNVYTSARINIGNYYGSERKLPLTMPFATAFNDKSLKGNLARHGIADGVVPNAVVRERNEEDSDSQSDQEESTDDEVEYPHDVAMGNGEHQGENVDRNNEEDLNESQDLFDVDDDESQVSSDSEPER